MLFFERPAEFNEAMSADVSRFLGHAEVAALLEGLGHNVASVRIAAFEALIRLPLDHAVWVEVDAHVGAVLESSKPVVGPTAVVDGSPWIPLHSTRERVARLTVTDSGEVAVHARRAVAALEGVSPHEATDRRGLSAAGIGPSLVNGEPPGFVVFSDSDRVSCHRRAGSDRTDR